MSDTFRLWLDGQCLQTTNRNRGIGRYIGGLIRGIADHAPHVDLHISLNADMPEEAVAARDFLSRWIRPDNIHVWHGTATQGEAVEGLTDKRLLSETALAYHVACLAPDIALSTNPFEGANDRAVPLLPNRISGVPIASIFYDAIPFRFPDRYLSDKLSSQHYRRRLAAFRDFNCNLCISDFAKEELANLIGVNPSVTIGAGISDHFMNCLPPLPLQRREQNALLYVCDCDWHKNVPAVMEAISQLEETQKGVIKFLVVGNLSVDAETLLRRKWLGLQLSEENLQFIGHVPDGALVDYCQRVSAVIQPSFMDGVGLTVLEAALCGTPVMTASSGAIPEVVNDNAHLFDPTDCADIARHISHVLGADGGARSSLEATDDAREFSWKRTATLTIDTLANVARHQTGSRPIRNADLIAKEALLSTDRLRLPQNLIIDCLARSEIRKTGRTQRLVVEATATVISDGGSGIQRVVKKICSTIPSETDAPVVIGFSDNSSEWFEVNDRRLSLGPKETKETGARIFFTQRDHILMLDSSWAFHHVHSKSLINARLRGAKVTTCLYDTVPLRASGFTHSRMPPVFSQWLQTALTYSTGFVCISKAVADEFVEILRQLRFPRPLDIGFWPLGADFGPIYETTPEETRDTSATNFLMVGTIEPRKGYGVALDAFDLLWEQNVNVKLTIVGKMGWNVENLVRRLKRHPQWGRRLFWRDNATDIELGQEYASADCLIASSFAEGFGLPIVEAGYFGKKIIASDIPVFREVASKSVGSSFFAVGDPRSLADSVRSFHESGQSASSVTKPDQAWENWHQSATRLKEVVLQDKWYCRYIPENGSAFTNPSSIGTFTMTEPLNEAQSHQSLHLVDGPMSADSNDAQKFIVGISNESDRLWSSKGDENGALGVFLGCRLFDAEGHFLHKGNRTAIPLIIAPGDTVYMPIEVPNEWLKYKEAVVHIEMFQEGSRWWGEALVISIRDIAASACA